MPESPTTSPTITACVLGILFETPDCQRLLIDLGGVLTQWVVGSDFGRFAVGDEIVFC